ncbi:AGE family epimerase/isomerase [Haloarchaeobius sp. TZWWS8]|uniref:AGE family epimerase/isomerase n=1 Tax=Haloarchaeobius sp. TZWWS8 TaxID=3446121 RepID=UPI003EC03382
MSDSLDTSDDESPFLGQTSATVRDPRWLHQHAMGLLRFYHPTCIDNTHGGYIAQLSDHDGTVYDSRAKFLPATCRFVFNFSVGTMLDGPAWCRQATEHGLDYLLSVQRDAETGGYPWLMDGRDVADETRSPYGHAFVLLALATAARAGIADLDDELAETYDLIDRHFWEPDHGLCRSNLTADWEPKSDYRGQNANMHMCEAHLAAYEYTNEEQYLDRAYTIAETLALTLTDWGDGLLWEHYTEDWDHDWAYNRDQPADLFRPWGYQPGHLLEWSKLLCTLASHRDEEWLVDRAERFFDAAVSHGWDDERGGFVYNFDRDHEVIVADTYYWPLAEGIGACVRLADATGDERYMDWYDRIWSYAWDSMVNRGHGNWYFRLTPNNEVHPDVDDTPEVKVGYHQLGACFEALQVADDGTVLPHCR